MSVEDTSDVTSADNDEPTPTNYFFAPSGIPMQPGMFDASFLQQSVEQNQSRIPFPYIPSISAGHPTLPMGAFLMPPYYSPLGPFYPTSALPVPYPFMLPIMATPPIPASVSSESCNNAASSDSSRIASPHEARQTEEMDEKEDSDTESMSVAAPAGSSTACDLPWHRRQGNTVQVPASEPVDVADSPSVSTASVRGTRGSKSFSSLEELLSAKEGESQPSQREASTCTVNSVLVVSAGHEATKPLFNSPQLTHFHQLLSRCKMAKFVQIRSLTTEGEGLTWLEITRRSCHIDTNLGPVNVARILVSSNGLCKFQLLYPYFKTVSTRLMPADEEGAELLLKDLGPQYVLCPGLPDYEQKYDIIGYHVPHVRVMNTGHLKRYDHDNCLLWHVPTNLFAPSGHHLHNMCQHCKYLENKLAKLCTKDKSQSDVRKESGRGKGSGRATATPPYDPQQRGQKQRDKSVNAGEQGKEAGSKYLKRLLHHTYV